MAKRIVAKTGEYQDKTTGETKGEWTDIGVILSNENGEYVLLNPAVNLAGVLMKQRILNQGSGKKSGDSVMCAVFDNSQKQGQSQAQQQPADFDDDVGF